jgi:hypothetical protein
MSSIGLQFITESVSDRIEADIPAEFSPWSLKPSEAWDVEKMSDRPNHDSIPIVSEADQFDSPTQIGCVELWLEENIGRKEGDKFLTTKQIYDIDVRVWEPDEFVTPDV